MRQYLLELGCEEIPARFMPGFLKTLESSVSSALDYHRLTYDSVQTLGTYRRLILIVSGLASHQTDLDEWVKGPPAKIAFNESGQPLPPAIGFAKKMGVTPDDLSEQDGACYARRFEKGNAVNAILPELIANCIQQWSLPIAMRWGTQKTPFFRPLHWIVSLLDETVVPMTLFGISAGNTSYGHRMLTQNPHSDALISGAPITVQSGREFLDQLRDHFVEPDPAVREHRIVEAIEKEPVLPALLEELVYLVEWPTVLPGTFDSSYLEIPHNALIDCMQKHQKYIPRRASNGDLLSQFWVVAESVTPANQAQIIRGNERVLKARLEDVKFFWEEDTAHSVESFLPKLETVVFQKNLGSMADKTHRIGALALYLNDELSLGGDSATIKRAATLCKADLVSGMVIEMPALQGAMGRLFLDKQGESSEISAVSEQHYWPKFVGDKLPESDLSALISIADKIDTIVACFVNKLNPTGSQDPWGVRRAVLGILQIMKAKSYDINIEALVEMAYQTLSQPMDSRSNCQAFISQRFEQDLVDSGLKKDTVKALSQTILSDFHYAMTWGATIDALRSSDPERFKQLVETAVRVTRLSKKQTGSLVVDTALFSEPIETIAYQTLISCENAAGALSEPDMTPFLGIVPVLITYFDEVLVMDKDPQIQANRLAFLASVHNLFSQVLDWEQLTLG